MIPDHKTIGHANNQGIVIMRTFLYRASVPWMDIRLENGRTLRYRLLPGNALSGFLVNPLLQSEDNLVHPFLKQGEPIRVTDARVCSNNGGCFDDSVHFEMKQIEGIPALQCDPNTK